MWSYPEILDTIQARLQTEDQLLRDQQAVRGLDAMREIDMHLLVAQSFSDTPETVLREVCYPSFETELPRRSQRDRCDLVVLPDGKFSIYDPVDAHKSLRSAAGTLFEPIASLPTSGPKECRPEDALWIEIKVVAQHRYIDGVPVPNPKYAHELLSGPRSDVAKLSSDPSIHHAGVLVMLFGECKEAGIHDLSIAMREMIDLDLPVTMPEYGSLPINDLGGNAWCTLGLIPLRL